MRQRGGVGGVRWRNGGITVSGVSVGEYMMVSMMGEAMRDSELVGALSQDVCVCECVCGFASLLVS